MKDKKSQLAGYLLASMIFFSILHSLNADIPLVLPGLCAWIALLFLLKKLDKPQLFQSLILSLAGIFCLLWASDRGVAPAIGSVLSKNHLLLSLLAGVSFLRLVTLPNALDSEDGERLPEGKGAFIQTLFGTHVFSAAINLSAIMIVAERLNFRKNLDETVAVLLTRAFAAAAFWSPFFAAMATALTYSPNASLARIILMGLPLSLVGLLLSVYSLNNRENKLEKFTGYPLHFSALWIPGLLGCCVFLTHYYFPDISILAVIAALSIMITTMILFISKPQKLLSIMDHHIVTALPKMANELGLFLSAGILAAGLSSLLSSYNHIPDFTHAGFLLLISLLAAMVALALIGFHPVISIAAVAIWLEPLRLDPDLLALVFVYAWGLSIAVSPLSGLNLALQGRFGIPGVTIMKWNALYTLQMFAVASLLLWFYSQ